MLYQLHLVTIHAAPGHSTSCPWSQYQFPLVTALAPPGHSTGSPWSQYQVPLVTVSTPPGHSTKYPWSQYPPPWSQYGLPLVTVLTLPCHSTSSHSHITGSPILNTCYCNANTCVFTSLLDEESASVWGEFTVGMQRHWKCPDCGRSMIVSVLERLQHQALCISDQGQGTWLLSC